MATERATETAINVAAQPSKMLESAAPPSNLNPPLHAPPSAEGDPFRSREGSPRRGVQINMDPPDRVRPLPGDPRKLSAEKLDDMDTLSGFREFTRNGGNQGLGTGQPLPPLPPVRLAEPGIRRQLTTDTRASTARRSAIDWIVPVEEKPVVFHNVAERLQPTLDVAILERDKYASKAKITAYALNAAIGLQILFGSLTTGLSAVATTGKSAAVQTTILGGLSTIVASYLARARGSNEPELSITRTKDLEQFIRECKAFQLDHGHVAGNEYDDDLTAFRKRFEELLGNANGERRLSPPV